ncbi:AAA family ATPase [Planctomycetota bacterium]
MSPHQTIQELIVRVSKSIIGQDTVVERLILGLLANGNLLLEGLPGLAKTRAVKSLAKCLDADMSRIQFTPDLLPSDITGSEIYLGEDAKERFEFQAGPIFSNLVLADEINRAPAKVQAALLEAMEERQVTVAGTTHTMPELFMVLATQNPVEQEGTYPLPEAQMDRFLMHVKVTYPSDEDEGAVMRLVRNEEGVGFGVQGSGKGAKGSREDVIPQSVVFEAREEVYAVHVAEAIEQYIVQLVSATRYPDKYGEPLSQWIEVGSSPRATIALDKCSRAHAWLKGRDHVTPDDVRAIVHNVLRHRLILSYEANAEGVTPDKVVDEILKVVAVV